MHAIMINGLIGKKIDQVQMFLEDGTRVPVSRVRIGLNVVTQIKSKDQNGYSAIQLGFDTRKKSTRSLTGHSKKAGMEKTPRFFREVRVDDVSDFEIGKNISTADVFKAGDVVDVTGTSKGKGYAGVVKRHHFKGGPRTHGQSDRERAPGSIGQTTTPGRVYKGKKMAGRMGNETVTVKNLEVVDVDDSNLFVKGLIPGVKDGLVVVRKVGEKKKFVPLFKKVDEGEQTEVVQEEAAAEIVKEPSFAKAASFADPRFAEGSGEARVATKAESAGKEAKEEIKEENVESPQEAEDIKKEEENAK